MEFGHHIRQYEQEIFAYLSELIAIPSVAELGDPQSQTPFGAASAQALESILEKGRSMGFTVENVGNFAGHVEYNCGGDGMAAVLTHVDVVPAGSGWDTNPFQLTERDGLLFGRGVLDDKGAAVVSLFCLKALKDHNVVGKRKLRCIFGSGEEIGMVDMPHYFQQEPLPDLAFTPDGDYGICNREKGILHFTWAGDHDSDLIVDLEGGQVANAVPDHARAVLRCTGEEADHLKRAAEAAGEDVTVTWDEATGLAAVSILGKAAHAREPENGHNGVLYLLSLINTVFGAERMGAPLRFLWEKIALETTGKTLGVAQEDRVSGSLTLNIGVVRKEGSRVIILGDIRYPVTADGEAIVDTLAAEGKAYGLTLTVQDLLKPLYAEENSPLVSILRQAYTSATGEEAVLYGTGGGSYARCLQGRCVAFGPLFPGEPDRHMHQCNEHVDKVLFMRHAEICLEAMYRLIVG